MLHFEVSKKPSSERDFLSFQRDGCATPPKGEERSLAIDEIENLEIVREADVGGFTTNGAFYIVAVCDLAVLNSATHSCYSRKMIVTPHTKQFENCPRIHKIMIRYLLLVLQTQDGRTFLCGSESDFQWMFADYKAALQQMTHCKSSALDSLDHLLYIDHDKWFQGEQVKNYFEVQEGVIFQTTGNNFYAVLKDRKMKPLSQLIIQEEEEAQQQQKFFYKLNFPNTVKKMWTTNTNRIAYVAEDKLFYCSADIQLQQLDIKHEICVDVLMLTTFLICLTTTGTCYVFEERRATVSRIHDLPLHPSCFHVLPTELHYIDFNGDPTWTIYLQNVFLFSPTHQCFYLLDTDTNHIRMAPFEEVVSRQAPEAVETPAKTDEEEEAEEQAESTPLNKRNALRVKFLKNKQKHGWRIKKVLTNATSMILELEREKMPLICRNLLLSRNISHLADIIVNTSK